MAALRLNREELRMVHAPHWSGGVEHHQLSGQCCHITPTSDAQAMCIGRRFQDGGTSEEASRTPPNFRRPDDAGVLVTLSLDEKTVLELRSQSQDQQCSYWTNLTEAAAAVLSASPLDVTVWGLTDACNSLQITVPAQVEDQLKHVVPVPCDRLKKLGIVAASLGEKNDMIEAFNEMKLMRVLPTRQVCIHLAERSLQKFRAGRSSHLAQLIVVMKAPSEICLRVQRATWHRTGIRLLLLLESECCKRLCEAVADDSLAAAGAGIMRVIVHQQCSVSLGMSTVDTDKKDSKSKDTSKEMPVPDKPDRENETWRAWVRLRRSRGTHLGSTIYLVRGKNQGKPAWHYVDVRDSLLSEFQEKTKGGSLDVADYGEVILSGWGEDPPQDVVDAIARDYG